MPSSSPQRRAGNAEIVTLDGRRLRSEDSRRRIVRAMLELVREGDFEPSAEAVAERAGVGQRSVFRHFKDMEGLRREMSATVAAEVKAVTAEPLRGATWREKLDELIERRANAFELVMPFRRAGNAQQHRSQVIQANHRRLNQTLRAVLRSVLPDAIARDALILEALDMALCFESWIRLRTDQGLSAKQAKAVAARLAEALVDRG
jgi:AcrR family transcriptional regulator